MGGMRRLERSAKRGRAGNFERSLLDGCDQFVVSEWLAFANGIEWPCQAELAAAPKSLVISRRRSELLT